MMEIDIDGYGTMTGPHSFTIMANKRILELIQGHMVLHLKRQR